MINYKYIVLMLTIQWTLVGELVQRYFTFKNSVIQILNYHSIQSLSLKYLVSYNFFKECFILLYMNSSARISRHDQWTSGILLQIEGFILDSFSRRTDSTENHRPQQQNIKQKSLLKISASWYSPSIPPCLNINLMNALSADMYVLVG